MVSERSSNRQDKHAYSLTTASSEWADAALTAWANQRLMQVVALAPMAVEQACKAALWSINPALLAPLDRQQEAALLALATKPDLNDPRLRTIGLRESLERASKVIDDCPLPKSRLNRLIDCRNGAIHVGSHDSETARNVLSDCLALIRWLLPTVGIREQAFHHKNMVEVVELLNERKSRTERHVTDELAKARRRFDQLRQTLDEKLLKSTIESKEQKYLGAESGWSLPNYARAFKCPACGCQARLQGVVSLEPEIGSSDREMPGGLAANSWLASFAPESFICYVCNLSLWSHEELEAATLPWSHMPLDLDTVTFNVEALAEQINPSAEIFSWESGAP